MTSETRTKATRKLTDSSLHPAVDVCLWAHVQCCASCAERGVLCVPRAALGKPYVAWVMRFFVCVCVLCRLFGLMRMTHYCRESHPVLILRSAIHYACEIVSSTDEACADYCSSRAEYQLHLKKKPINPNFKFSSSQMSCYPNEFIDT